MPMYRLPSCVDLTYSIPLTKSMTADMGDPAGWLVLLATNLSTERAPSPMSTRRSPAPYSLSPE